VRQSRISREGLFTHLSQPVGILVCRAQAGNDLRPCPRAVVGARGTSLALTNRCMRAYLPHADGAVVRAARGAVALVREVASAAHLGDRLRLLSIRVAALGPERVQKAVSPAGRGHSHHRCHASVERAAPSINAGPLPRPEGDYRDSHIHTAAGATLVSRVSTVVVVAHSSRKPLALLSLAMSARRRALDGAVHRLSPRRPG